MTWKQEGGAESPRHPLFSGQLTYLASEAALAAFFDGDQSVMVMCDDLKVRRNRLNLLALLRNQASVLADFSQIQA